MAIPRSVPIRPSQALLFAPAALLLLAALIMARNFCSRPAVRAKDFPDRGHEVVIYLEYPAVYPFQGDVQAVLEIHRLSGRVPVFKKDIGARRWASEAISDFNTIEWPDPDRIVLQSRDGTRTQPVRVRGLEDGTAPDGDGF